MGKWSDLHISQRQFLYLPCVTLAGDIGEGFKVVLQYRFLFHRASATPPRNASEKFSFNAWSNS
ncbi:MAG: hypothetical protein KAU38_13055, partial [Desulfobacterales bacterium]|nr:hypothetical protein [Desulfobacterales bacterium]